ncbi:M23 family metallopeptidase [Terricaulis silvestris]|uniref:Glycyl-glycine endopeptidase ALE-1 n=1 Tax=Terricaulis silvestris TaxID=2686094 RepID=A0A6I6MNY3_9CAUL|nr:M23 family metallopeptidase [Terricaulis silvestris]QGZ94487.1 Glycyl-glycine endopeptidase ALE-1 precursor [Terricaulis silvestris]
MKLVGGILALLLVACAAPDAPAQPEQPPVATPPIQVVSPVDPPPPATLSLNCAGAFTQGGVALCRTLPGAVINVDGVSSGIADAQGWAVIGFPRDHDAEAVVAASEPVRTDGVRQDVYRTVEGRYAIAPRQFDIQRVDGLPQQTVTPTDPEVIARIQREAAVKQQGWNSYADIEGFLDGFIIPVEGGRVSGTWGNQRVLNGVPASPHFGYDIAAPAGTPIRAPAAGVVTLAQPDMHYEGGLVFIDHGQNLITMYLHMSRLDVQVGDRVEQGQGIGAVGSSGRATGPHLCWRMKWRDRQLDPSVALQGLSAARAALISAN